jgi:hypothetical protein
MTKPGSGRFNRGRWRQRVTITNINRAVLLNGKPGSMGSPQPWLTTADKPGELPGDAADN